MCTVFVLRFGQPLLVRQQSNTHVRNPSHPKSHDSGNRADLESTYLFTVVLHAREEKRAFLDPWKDGPRIPVSRRARGFCVQGDRHSSRLILPDDARFLPASSLELSSVDWWRQRCEDLDWLQEWLKEVEGTA